ncbi:hypothetical protein [Rhizobium sp. NZLR1]|uniref:hypothetical protein n=1 Tax=Rhizobium sp. NZLR1 TaxID=2731096 RepID=UPI001A983CC3|nr:hypothetical protein [Rhizobium sp. NZLR1]MBX5204017.1 hypothetical protein [Rhizobium sp. NZLR1]QSZ25182.1 hypothetical protein J3O30_33040 [Rhizobium sp. NZLR1]
MFASVAVEQVPKMRETSSPARTAIDGVSLSAAVPPTSPLTVVSVLMASVRLSISRSFTINQKPASAFAAETICWILRGSEKSTFEKVFDLAHDIALLKRKAARLFMPRRFESLVMETCLFALLIELLDVLAQRIARYPRELMQVIQ